MRTLDTHCQHALKRAQQRCVPPLVDLWLDEVGVEEFDGHGSVRTYFTRKSIRQLERTYGREPVSKMTQYLNIYRVESASDGRVITYVRGPKRPSHRYEARPSMHVEDKPMARQANIQTTDN